LNNLRNLASIRVMGKRFFFCQVSRPAIGYRGSLPPRIERPDV